MKNELIYEKYQNIKQKEQLENFYFMENQNAIKLADEDANQNNISLRQQIILKKVVERIRL